MNIKLKKEAKEVEERLVELEGIEDEIEEANERFWRSLFKWEGIFEEGGIDNEMIEDEMSKLSFVAEESIRRLREIRLEIDQEERDAVMRDRENKT